MLIYALLLLEGKLCKQSSSKVVTQVQYLDLTGLRIVISYA